MRQRVFASSEESSDVSESDIEDINKRPKEFRTFIGEVYREDEIRNFVSRICHVLGP